MGLFQRKRFVWYEPWFFQQRIRTVKSWVLFSLLLLAVGGAIGAGVFFAAPAGRPASLLEAVGLGLGASALLWWVWDGTETRRQAILFEKELIVGGDMGKYSSPTTYQLAMIPEAVIVLPDESKWPDPGLYFRYDGQEQAIGIESGTSLKRLAQALHDAGVRIHLKDWLPGEENQFEQVFSWQADPADVTGKATTETLLSGTPSLMTPVGILAAIVRQCWAIVLWLMIAGGAVYYGYQNWNNLGLLQTAMLFVVPLGTMMIAAQCTDRFACAATSQGLTRMARAQIRKRDGIQVDPDAGELIPVEIFARDQFEKTVQKIHEMGFIQADQDRRRMLFEGKKERWCLPVDSIRSVAIEEVQTGTPGQSATGTLNYYVVVRFAADEDREFGFRYAERDYGEFNDVKRAEGGIRVYETFESLVDSE